MYTDDTEKKGFPLRDFLLKLILVIVFVVLFVWLFTWLYPKPVMPDIPDITPLTSQIFKDNLKTMQDAATSYYTDERLPQQIGDKKSMTLEEMLKKHLLVAFVDKHGKACDAKKSYVEITKMDDEYLLKVNLKCSSEEDYIYVHMGCYTYCDKDICQKQDAPIITTPTNNKPKPTTPVTPDEPDKPKMCSLTCGPNQTLMNPDSADCYCKTNENPPTPKMCSLTCGPNETLMNPDSADCYCKTNENPPVDDKEYEYEYSKTVKTATIGKWTNWSNWTLYKNNVNMQAKTCALKDVNCLEEIETKLEKDVKVGTYEKQYVKNRQKQIVIGSYQQKYCSDWEYLLIESTQKVYATKGGGQYVKSGNPQRYDVAPADNYPYYYYEHVATKADSCDDCSALPGFWYQKYVWQANNGGQLVQATGNPSVTVSCSSFATKTIKIYGTTTVSDIVTREEPVYATLGYYRNRTRNVTFNTNETKKWSKYNDQSLLTQGYTYTGNKKEIKK